ncbi:MAG: avidin/streptavidin [Rhodospirillaceae bacterium]|nr:MAG: avidin/streptavidin [Rhodospirillaceae bacterium]
MSKRLASILGHSLAALCVAVPLANAQSPSVTGTWVNDHGSTLVIRSIGADGSVTGTYASSTPGYKCAGVAFPIVGWMDGQRISYTVLWKNASVDCNSITSWTGYLNAGRLGVEWVVTFDEYGAPTIRTGSDSYVRQ